MLRQLRAQLQLIGTTVELLADETERQRVANLAVIETPEQLQQALRTRCGRTMTGDLARTLVLLEAVLRSVTPAELDRIPINKPTLAAAKMRILDTEGGASISDDDVRLVIAALWPRYGGDLLRASKSWQGRKGPVRRSLDRLANAEQRG